MAKKLFVSFMLIVSVCLCSCENARITILSARAMFARNNADLDAAERIYKEMIKIQPTVAEHYWELGTLYASRNNKPMALKQLEILKKLGRDDLVETLKQFIDL